jgi:hypothetical protein
MVLPDGTSGARGWLWTRRVLGPQAPCYAILITCSPRGDKCGRRFAAAPVGFFHDFSVTRRGPQGVEPRVARDGRGADEPAIGNGKVMSESANRNLRRTARLSPSKAA